MINLLIIDLRLKIFYLAFGNINFNANKLSFDSNMCFQSILFCVIKSISLIIDGETLLKSVVSKMTFVDFSIVFLIELNGLRSPLSIAIWSNKLLS